MSPNISSLFAGKPLFFRIVLLIGIILFGFYIYIGVLVFRYGDLNRDFGWGWIRKNDGWYVLEVDPNGMAAGKLLVGDRVGSINGDTRVGSPWFKLRSFPLDAPYTIDVERNSTKHQFGLELHLKRDYKQFTGILTNLTVSFLFCSLAIFIGLLKPEQRIIKLFCITLLIQGLGRLSAGIAGLDSAFIDSWKFLIVLGNGFILPALYYDFYHRFPAGVSKGRFWSFLAYFFYALCAAIAIPYKLITIVLFRGEEATNNLLFNNPHIFDFAVIVEQLVFPLIVIASCAVIIRNYRLLEEPHQRRQIKWVAYGSVAGLLPLTIVNLAAFILPKIGHADILASNTSFILGLISWMALVILPLSVIYAIVNNRLFDIKIIIRRNLQYLLAKNVLRIALLIPIVGLGVTIYYNSDRTLKEILFNNSAYFYLFVAASVSLRFRDPFSDWIDKKFFREVYNQEQILLGILDEIKNLDSMFEISKLVGNKLDLALHPKGILIFYRIEGEPDLSLGFSLPELSQDQRIPEYFQLLRIMDGQEKSLESPLSRRANLLQNEKEWLEQLGINLIVPMNSSDHHLLGLLLLGEKMSEEPYSATDRKLLEAIARQIAGIYETMRLKEQMGKELKIKHDVLSHLEEKSINLLKECPRCGACYDSSQQICRLDRSELTLSLPVERVIDGKYRIDRLIGKGGMGAVYEARDLRLNRKIAIKILLGNMFGDQESLRRFEREAHASARLNHPNVVTVYDYGRTGAEGAFLVMEFVYGITLRSELEKSGNLNPNTVADWFDQLFEGIKAAHLEGIIHRDLKPDNVLIAKQDNGQTLIKVFDFGIAKMNIPIASMPSTITNPGIVMGTIGYIAPELLNGEKADARSDIFALGVMVIEALTGQLPFDGMTMGEVINATLHTGFHFKSDSDEVRYLDDVIQKCIAKNPAKRFASVSEMQKELIPAIRNCSSLPASELFN